jgi:hypothetical protein
MQGAIAQRVLGLLLGLTFAPGAPTEVAQSKVLSESLSHYAARDAKLARHLIWDYMKRCISQVSAPKFRCRCQLTGVTPP